MRVQATALEEITRIKMAEDKPACVCVCVLMYGSEVHIFHLISDRRIQIKAEVF